MEKEIPQSVIKEAQSLINSYGQCLEFLGNQPGVDYYVFRFPDETITGFPFVYIYDRETHKAMQISGFDAIDIISKFNTINNNK